MQKLFNSFYNQFNDLIKSTNLENKKINKFVKKYILQKFFLSNILIQQDIDMAFRLNRFSENPLLKIVLKLQNYL